MSDRITLAFDTTGLVLSVAVAARGQVWRRVHVSTQNQVTQDQSSFLVPIIQDVCHEAGVALADVTHVATLRGPGSFTGIRIGLATLAGLQLAKPRVCFVPTSLMMAAFVHYRLSSDSSDYLACVDNKRGGAYVQKFNHGLCAQEEPWVMASCEGPYHDLRADHLLEAFDVFLAQNRELPQDTHPFYVVTPSYVKRPGY